MPDHLVITIIPVAIAATIGYLAQSIGLCMVRGVKELRAGKPGFMAAILCCGLWIWVAVVSSSYIGHAVPFHSFKANIWFALGGFLFGMGTAINQGCGVSTLNHLSRGDLKMLATVAGWVIGWICLARWPIQMIGFEPRFVPDFVLPALIGGSVVITGWVALGDRERRKTWFSIMAIGLLAGLLFTFEPSWAPSGLLRDLSAAAMAHPGAQWPELTRYQIFLALLAGMVLAAWRHKRFVLVTASPAIVSIHLLAGLLMGIGGAIAMGGNDAQLLLALPTLSASSFITVLAMMLGIFAGLKLHAVINNVTDRA